jgi:hypothetical protein
MRLHVRPLHNVPQPALDINHYFNGITPYAVGRTSRSFTTKNKKLTGEFSQFVSNNWRTKQKLSGRAQEDYGQQEQPIKNPPTKGQHNKHAVNDAIRDSKKGASIFQSKVKYAWFLPALPCQVRR